LVSFSLWGCLPYIYNCSNLRARVNLFCKLF
jgi:hypothetical protein